MSDTARGSVDHRSSSRRKGVTAAWLAAVAASMVGVSFAAVPLYDLFCKVTGYGGTTQVAAAAAARSERKFTVRFDANVAAGMGWIFEAPAPVEVFLGETALVAYKARNITNRPVLGTATHNVVPFQAGPYFTKVACFCFTEQLLMPGEEKEFPVSFFVDPAIAEDHEQRGISSITLSYTFFNKGPDALKKYLANTTTAAAQADRNAGNPQ
ncbi:cytochrome c oxidase assembly protein [Microvirga sp. VF16]|uniref:cytochrome c oxidase assembly protein n=1 Tax=Microvirga sp. VF16 TaxID=2807101 RepID=UPI00193CF0EC|nr:cytochrome c oxidase assembly protein [Microvirga sp. VF16]QRM34683.1 cytochrome c oxidase assembly protein [Microvirga sp. VF16]